MSVRDAEEPEPAGRVSVNEGDDATTWFEGVLEDYLEAGGLGRVVVRLGVCLGTVLRGLVRGDEGGKGIIPRREIT